MNEGNESLPADAPQTGPEGADNSEDEIADQIAAVRASAESAVNTAVIEFQEAEDAIDKTTREKFRGSIAMAIVTLFAVVIAAAVIYAVVESQDAIADIDNMLESYVYPVVLLVLGFYFGARQTETGDADNDG